MAFSNRNGSYLRPRAGQVNEAAMPLLRGSTSSPKLVRPRKQEGFLTAFGMTRFGLCRYGAPTHCLNAFPPLLRWATLCRPRRDSGIPKVRAGTLRTELQKPEMRQAGSLRKAVLSVVRRGGLLRDDPPTPRLWRTSMVRKVTGRPSISC